MKYCAKCGAQNEDNANFCTECGTAFAVSNTTENNNFTYEPVENDSVNNNFSSDAASAEDKYTYVYNADNNSRTNYSTTYPGITKRNIVVAIILSIVTCGIYQLYWIFKINNEVNTLANEPTATSGGIVLLLSIVTCGIYSIYWSYKMGERCDQIKGNFGGNSAILYLILTLLGLGIVTICLIQDTINKAV